MGNYLDDFIGFFSPETALRRIRARFQNEALRNFELASKGRRNEGWRSSGASADNEISKALPLLRNRMREQDRNNSYAKKAVNVIKNNTIGPGIRLSIKSKPKSKQKEKVLEYWNDFADEKTCDFDSHLNFYGLQGLVMRTVALSGECLIIKNVTKFEKGKIPLKLRVLECDHIDDSKDGVETSNGNITVQGIEFDSKGRRIAYWLFPKHPGDNNQSDIISTRVPAENIIHVFLKERPGQNRGVPFGTASGITLKDLKDYQDAELLRQKIASCFALFVHDDKDSIVGNTGSTTTMIDKVEPGIIEHLPPGKTITFATPPATSGYSEHTKRLLQNVAAGWGITYEALTGDMSLVNFSSGRLGWLEFHRQITDWQLNMMIPMMCDGVFNWFFEICVLAGYLVDEKIKSDWTPPRREMIDPVKEINGLKLQIRNGLISWQEAVRELGYDPDNLISEIDTDFKKLKEMGIILDCDPRNDLKEVKVKK